MANWKRVTPNPDHYQLCANIGRPDLFIATCFSSMNISQVSSFMTGRNLSISNAWKIFDSMDISLTIQSDEDPLSPLTVSVTARNCGNAPGRSKAHIKSCFIPFIISDWKVTLDDLQGNSGQNFDNIKPTSPFFATGTIDIDLQPITNQTGRVVYDRYYFMGPRSEPLEKVDKRLLKKVKDAIVITTVDIDAAASEVLFANNNAIEIVTLK
jgi:hypothetical protein